MGEPTGLAPEQLSALDRLKTVQGVDQLYLAGGSAIAFHLGHRRSLDLDLRRFDGSVDLDRLRDRLAAELPELAVNAASDVALHLDVSGVRVDIVQYPYPLLESAGPGPSGFPVASLPDLAAMKLAAIARRGIRRDFWDLFSMVDSGLALADCVEAYKQRYGTAATDLYHVLRSLTYFEDAERDPVLPLGMDDALWERIKAFFERHAPLLLADESV